MQIDVTGRVTGTRSIKWDLLRSLSMFAVVVVHSNGYLGPINDISTSFIGVLALVCDPIFFALSGYFAIRALKSSIGDYYFKKFLTIIVPLFVHSCLLFLFFFRSTGLSLPGYIQYFQRLLTPWWFAPYLLPFLVVSPFLFRCFEGLTDGQAFLLVKIALGMSMWGTLASFLSWAFGYFGHETLVGVMSLFIAFVPVSIIPNNYFIYFCMGYFLRRLLPKLGKLQKRALILMGLAFWIVDAAFAHFGIDRVDPSYAWLPATVGFFVLFDSLKSDRLLLGSLISWTARRSYSIYLLQATTIDMAASFVYGVLFAGNIAQCSATVRILAWVCLVVIAYLSAWVIASIVDIYGTIANL